MNDTDTGNDIRKNTACPFCGLLCTDVDVKVDGLRLSADAKLPEACRAAYQTAGLDGLDGVPSPQIQGRDADLNDAVAHAAELLKQSAHPLFAGLAADLNTIRAVIRAARRHGGTVDHVKNPTAGALRVTQNYGWISGTLSEAAGRADLFVVLGRASLSVNPRFAERILARRSPDASAAASGDVAAPRIVFVGAFEEDDIPDVVKRHDHEIIRLPDEALSDAVRRLNLLSLGKSPATGDAVPSECEEPLRRLHKALTSSRYGCVAWHSGAFGEQHTDFGLTSVSRLVRHMNLTTRCINLPLGNNYGDNTANNCAVWHTGKPACLSFSGGDEAHYDPTVYNTANMIAKRRTDAVFWITPLAPLPPPEAPPEGDIKTVVLGHPATPLEHPPEVFIPTGIPGIDHAGHLFRVDSVVAMRLEAIRESGLPAAAEVLAQIDGQKP